MLIGLGAGLFSLFLYSRNIDFFNTIDLKLKDVRFRTRRMVPDSRVVIVAIDSRSINKLGRWPWDRKVIAGLIEALDTYGAKTIAMDIVFSEPSNASSDKELAGALRKSGNVIAGYFFRGEEGKPATVELLQRTKVSDVRLGSEVQGLPVVTFPGVEMNIPIISDAARSAGFFNILPDRDGILRFATLVALYRGDAYPSLPLAALRHHLANKLIIDVAQYGVDGLMIGNRRIPVDEAGRFTLNYYGRQAKFRTIPAVDVIEKRLDRDALKNTLVFVGATEIGISDVRATPQGSIPGVEVHATVASNVLQDRFLTRDGQVIALEIFLIILFPLLLAMFLRATRRTVPALIFLVAITGTYFFFNNFLFAHYSLNIGVIFPAISIGLTYLGSEAYRNFTEERQGRFLRKAFAGHVSADIVGQIVDNHDSLNLLGQKREISVLFCGIKGFPTLSENLPPESLVMLLNRYLGPMTDIILKHGGMLDKYIGDTIMALYNAPLTLEDHAAYVCISAVDMMDKLKEVNADLREKGLPEIDIGIGVSTGDAILGNMGTDLQFEYTAMGNTVDLAARLEDVTVKYRTHIIVSESTMKLLQATDIGDTEYSTLTFRELDLIKTAEKNRPVTIYELLLNADPLLVGKFGEAMKLYRQQKFNEALNIFTELNAEYKDGPSGVFMERCRESIVHPPDITWDGVYATKTK